MLTTPDKAVPTLRDFVCEKYMPWAAQQLAPHTVRDRVYVVARICDSLGDYPITAIPTAAVEEYKLRRLTRGVAPSTVNQDLIILRSVLKRARKMDYDVPAPKWDPCRIVTQARPAVAWEADDVQRIFMACKTVWAPMLPLVQWAVNTGMRPGEIVALRWMDLFETASTPHAVIGPRLGWRPKNGKTRRVPLSPEALACLPPRRGPEDHVFLSERGRPFGRFPEITFRKVLRAAGVKGSIYSARHTFASHYLSKKDSFWHLSQVMGNSPLVCQKTYAHYLMRTLIESAEGLPRFAPEADLPMAA